MMKISKVLYINLDHRKDRLASIQEVLSYCPYPTHRIQAIKPSDEDMKHYAIQKYTGEFISKRGVLGCALSHRKCIEHLISEDLPQDEYSMVLEDDVLIHKSFWTLLKTINISEDADITFFDSVNRVSFHGLHQIYSKTYPLSYKIPVGTNCRSDCHTELHGDNGSWTCFNGTHCLLYKNSKMQKILKLFNDIKVYKAIDNELILNKELNRYIIQTGLMHQDKKKLNSDIHKKENKLLS